MCAVALSHHLWKHLDEKPESKYHISVEYRRGGGEFVTNHYDITDVRFSTDKLELKMSIMRGGGGLACTVQLRRKSKEEGSLVVMTHDTIHISGLREEWNDYDKKISNGMHYNSERYRSFAGDFKAEGEELSLVCEVKFSNGSFYPVRYNLRRY
jgi:hypothetical protein